MKAALIVALALAALAACVTPKPAPKPVCGFVAADGGGYVMQCM